MSKLTHTQVSGCEVGSSESLRLDEVTLHASPEAFKALGTFLIEAAQRMAVEGLEHLHWQDVMDEFDPEHHVDFILVNATGTVPTATD